MTWSRPPSHRPGWTNRLGDGWRRTRRTWLQVWLVGLVLVSSTGLAPQALAKDPAEEAADQVVETLGNLLGDLTAVRNLPAAERIAWVRNQAKERVQEKALEKAGDKLKDAMKAYAEKAFRAKAFETIAAPALRNAYALGQPVDWALLNAQMGSEVATKVNAFNTALTGVKVGWSSVQAYRKQGAMAGFKALAGGVYDKVAEAYIPGWGWFKLGVKLTKAIGEYVLAYASDTAVEGMINTLFEPSADPGAFARLLLETGDAALRARLEDDWELVSGGFVYPGQGSDVGEEAMRGKILTQLQRMRQAALQRQAELQAEEQQLAEAMRPYLDEARAAEAALAAASAEVEATAAPFLSAIEALAGTTSRLQEEVLTEELGNYQAAASEDSPALPYTPLNRGPVLDLYQLAYAIYRDTPSDASLDLEQAEALSWQAMNAQAALINGQSEPPDGAGKPEWLACRTADRAALQREIGLIHNEAEQRGATLTAALEVALAEIRDDLAAARTTFETELAALEREATETLLSEQLFRTTADPSEDNPTALWIQNNVSRRLSPWSGLGPVGNYRELSRLRENLVADRLDLDTLESRRLSIFQAFELSIANARLAWDGLMPQNLRLHREVEWGSGEEYLQWTVEPYYPGVLTDVGVGVLHYRERAWNRVIFDYPQALAALDAGLTELRPAYEDWELQQSLEAALTVVRAQLEEFIPPAGLPADDPKVLLHARLAKSPTYRQPLAQSELAVFTQRFAAAWSALGTRVTRLRGHEARLSARQSEWDQIRNCESQLATFQQRLAYYQSLVDNAPAHAMEFFSTYEQGYQRWANLHVEDTPAYFEEAVLALENLSAQADELLRRGLAGELPSYVYLLEQNLTSRHASQVSAVLEVARQRLATTRVFYGETAPTLTSDRREVTGGVGAAVGVAFFSDTPGGTFSSPNLPPGLTLDPVQGVLSGTPARGGIFRAIVRYTAPSGKTVSVSVPFRLADPELVRSGAQFPDGLLTEYADWVEVPWLGFIYDRAAPWVLHGAFGWMYCLDNVTAGGWVWQFHVPSGGGWLFLSQDNHPYLYSLAAESWVYLLPGQEHPAYFNILATGEWLVVP